MRNRIFPRQPSPAALWMAGYEAARLGLEAQMVIGLRLMGLAGCWTLPAAETTRMFTEKQAAFTKAGLAVGEAALKGGSGDTLLRAGVKPLRAKTGANVKRLSRHALR